MSLFRRVGEKFEETKQAFVGGSESEYICRSCEEPVVKEYEHCPHCGEGPVEPAEERTNS